jgi:hypothetical protein
MVDDVPFYKLKIKGAEQMRYRLVNADGDGDADGIYIS